MLKHNLEKLVSTLSSSEKTLFRKLSISDRTEKDYLLLFELLCEKENESGIEEVYKEKYPKKSFDNTAAYLFKTLTNMLVQLRVDQDKWFHIHHCLMKAQLCFERSIPEMGLKELKKAQKLSDESQDHLMHYSATRMELTQISETGFRGMTEQELVNIQMKAKHNLQTLRQVQEHYSLYELLNYRFALQGTITEDRNSKKLNDLILSELSLTTRGSQHQFESKKLHLLFQSFFFIRIGEYTPALNIFKELNKLIEMHPHLWTSPPYDYLSALEGILDSLRTIGYYHEMDYFLEKIKVLALNDYTEHFSSIAKQSLFLYTLNMLLGKKQYKDAAVYLKSIKPILPSADQKINNETIMSKRSKIAMNIPHDGFISSKKQIYTNEKHLELLFFSALTFYLNKDLQKANQYIGIGIAANKNNAKSMIYRVSRLLRIIIHLELDNMDYLQYEIRAHKRLFAKQGKAFGTEQMLFNMIAADPKRSSPAKMRQFEKKYKLRLENLKLDKHEQQILKHFNFCEWIQEKI